MTDRPRLRMHDFKVISSHCAKSWRMELSSPHITKIKGSWDYLDSGDDEKDDLAMAFIERLDAEGK